ncbi:gamma-glutamyl-gamma-aminobutyrate hydrolase family protein [Maridesulfovibrio sp.]|uniref:gamma-glutamyl-gamma-aminobutyrate hydrolase family protein n=1 Tax=Maridesulfovibrio sp. TaxID=2795000 RepID=UPI003BAB0EEA
MRRSDACDYNEPRDGLALTWQSFIAAALPGSVWCALPNIGKDIVNTVKAFGLNCVILSGGESYSAYPERDETESTLIDLCIKEKIPLIGICRGFQMLHTFLGGRTAEVSPDKHVAKRHSVYFKKNPFVPAGEASVNSFHSNGINLDTLIEPFVPLALDAEGFVEAAYSLNYKQIGLMWHPEREESFSETDFAIFRSLFKTI